MKSKATSFDIAYRAGVSQSTVSRALRNSPLVNEETRLKVQAIARELNYKVDKNASNLRTQQSATIALLLFEDPTSDDSMINPFFLSMLGSITRACSDKGYDLLVSFQQMNNDWHADFEDTNKADGIILLGYGDFVDYEQKLQQLIAQNTRFVRWGAEVKGLPIVSVGCDNFHGGYQLTEHIIKNGRKQFAFLGGASSHSPEFLDRYLGHCKALADNDLTVDQKYQFDAISTEESGYNAARKLLSSGLPFDAIFGASDLIAIGAMRALQEHNINTPDDVAVIGFDDIPIASFTFPPLTTARQNTKLAGELLVDKLLKLINGETVDTTLMPTSLIVRKSCGS
ncbi:LacI family DNA-binding transcriptional regulator [Thalassomonas haliotis]|uniref:LacI family DNA-binding transcriptional regulator n=1 Tax=Thalassomonas haliotis TaxID=485448 RepID=A0ABY7VI34_9GAMM|nr:LacI family DNA-binding transcriptional regulator [Thalassomonas haliotis]WDE13027.1 LacI family DNA-binding transcriptional regulator [Thalassomonas haliotis]